MQCFCGSQRLFSECCEPFLAHQKDPETSEKLMRSRYSAFCKMDIDYIKETTHPQAEMDWRANEEWAKSVKFTRLVILNSADESNKGIVEFQAFFLVEKDGVSTEHCHHEVSHFRKHQGKWFYRDGRIVNKA